MQTIRTGFVVAVLLGWTAISAAAVIALRAGPEGAFAVLALGLVAAVTLRFSARWGAAAALVAAPAFAVVSAIGAEPVASLGHAGVLLRVVLSLGDGPSLAADVAAALALAGTLGLAELASLALQWEPVSWPSLPPPLRALGLRVAPPREVAVRAPRLEAAGARPPVRPGRPRPRPRQRPVGLERRPLLRAPRR